MNKKNNTSKSKTDKKVDKSFRSNRKKFNLFGLFSTKSSKKENHGNKSGERKKTKHSNDKHKYKYDQKGRKIMVVSPVAASATDKSKVVSGDRREDKKKEERTESQETQKSKMQEDDEKKNECGSSERLAKNKGKKDKDATKDVTKDATVDEPIKKEEPAVNTSNHKLPLQVCPTPVSVSPGPEGPAVRSPPKNENSIQNNISTSKEDAQEKKVKVKMDDGYEDFGPNTPAP